MYNFATEIGHDTSRHYCRHSLNNYDVYGIFIGDETLENLTYGLTTYDLHRHALMCVSPGQIGGKADTGDEIQTKLRVNESPCSHCLILPNAFILFLSNRTRRVPPLWVQR